MAADERPFPSPDELQDEHADEIRALLETSYAAQPLHDAAHVERVARAVLVQAMHASAPGARGVRPRWWWGAAAAAMLMVTVMRPWRPDATQREADSAMARSAVAADDTQSAMPSGSTAEEHGGTVRFEFTLPSAARAVALVGDFNGWDTDATPMVRQQSGTWSARVSLEPGHHEYAFVVDGKRWVVDPLAPQTPDEGFGPTNAVVVDGGAPQ